MKKGQLYIVTALFLTTLVFLLTAKIAKIDKPDDSFYEIHQNLISESSRVINSALYNEKDLSDQFSSFIEDFRDYAGSRNTEFHFFYAIAAGEDIIIYNYIDSTANITTDITNFILDNGNITTIERGKRLRSMIDGQEYDLDTSGDNIRIKLISKKVQRDNIEIYTYER